MALVDYMALVDCMYLAMNFIISGFIHRSIRFRHYR